MSILKSYASYILSEKFDELLDFHHKTLLKYKIPILDKLQNINEPEFINSIRINLQVFLESLINGTQLQLVLKRMEEWRQNRLPGIDKNEISLFDITSIYSGQKYSLISFIPKFTNNANDAIAIATLLEDYYKEVQEFAITILKEIENEDFKKLKESEEKYKDLFENATDLIHFADMDGKVLYTNNSWQKTLGYTSEELSGKYVLDLVADEEKEKYITFRERTILGEAQGEVLQTCYIAKDGSEISN